jgi:hypothetical protein
MSHRLINNPPESHFYFNMILYTAFYILASSTKIIKEFKRKIIQNRVRIEPCNLEKEKVFAIYLLIIIS